MKRLTEELDGRQSRGIFVEVYIPLRTSVSWCRGHHWQMETVPQSGNGSRTHLLAPKTKATETHTFVSIR